MVGWLTLEPYRGRRPELERACLMGLPLLHARVPAPEGLREKALLRRVNRAAAELCRAGVRRVLTQGEFPHWQALRAWGLREVDPAPLCQGLAAPLVLAALARRGTPPARAVVALAGTRVTRLLFQAADSLCPQVRGLVVCVPAGGDELARHLREEYGAPVLEPGAGPPPEVAVCFSAEAQAQGQTVLRLCGPRPELAGFRLGLPELDAQSAPEALPLAALLWEEGRIPLRKIEIISTSPDTN